MKQNATTNGTRRAAHARARACNGIRLMKRIVKRRDERRTKIENRDRMKKSVVPNRIKRFVKNNFVRHFI